MGYIVSLTSMKRRIRMKASPRTSLKFKYELGQVLENRNEHDKRVSMITSLMMMKVMTCAAI